jgi:hypothetical protein
VSVPYQSSSVRIREKYVTEPDMSERVHYNTWQRYFLALTHTELGGHVTNKCEWTYSWCLGGKSNGGLANYDSRVLLL